MREKLERKERRGSVGEGKGRGEGEKREERD